MRRWFLKMTTMKKLQTCLLIAFLGMSALSFAQSPSWKAGAAKVKVTPETNLWMAGYASRKEPANGVASDLFAKALAVEDPEGKRFVMITMDLIGVPRVLRLSMIEKLKSAHGLGAESWTINASHTHCGPEFRVKSTALTDEPTVRAAEAERFTEELEKKLLQLVTDALKAVEPAELRYGFARCGFAMNRRTPDGKGNFSNHPYPKGPVDHQVPVLQVKNSGGKELAILFGYNCHATTLGFQQYCADYPGFAQEALEKAHPGAVAMFVNGCSGDQNPYPRGTLELAQTHGRTLATAVEAALTTDLESVSGRLRAAHEEVTLNYSRTPTAAELEQTSATARGIDATHAGRLLGLLRERGSLPKDYPYPVQVVRMGDQVTFVALGGEVVVDYSLRLKAEMKDPFVWIAGYSNDVMTYIPSLRVLKEGGYEAGGAMKYGTHPAPWSETVEADIVGAVHRLRKTLD